MSVTSHVALVNQYDWWFDMTIIEKVNYWKWWRKWVSEKVGWFLGSHEIIKSRQILLG